VIPPEAVCLIAGLLLIVSLLFAALVYYAFQFMNPKADAPTEDARE
jgi:hypothetical protein